MVNISLTFIIAFPDDYHESKKSGKAKKKKSKGKEGTAKIDIPKEKNCIPVDNIQHFLHIEYNLLPNKPVSSIDIVSWGPITKVCSKDDVFIIRSIKRNNKFWAVFTVDNIFSLSLDDVIDLKTHQITVNAYLTKSKIPDKCRNDKTNEFFIPDEYVDENLGDDGLPRMVFCKAYVDKYEANNAEKKNLSGNINVKNISNNLSQYLHDSPNNSGKVLSIIKNNGVDVNCMNNGIEEYEFVNKGEKKGKKGKKGGKKNKKGGKGKKQKDLVSLTFSAQLFFTDLSFCLEFPNDNPKLSPGFIQIIVSDLLTPIQIKKLNPLIIKIDKITDLPSYALLDRDFISVYATCTIENLLSYCIGEHKISKNIQFKNHQVHFLKENEHYVKAVQWGNITITLYGRKQFLPPALFGTQKGDSRINKPMSQKGVEKELLNKALEFGTVLVPLCVCMTKLNSLSSHSPAMTLNKIEHCVHPGHITVSLKNLDMKYPPHAENLNPITADLLLLHGTSLDIKVRLNKPFRIPKSLKDNSKHYYKRIVLVIYKKFVAKTILTEVLKHNHYYLEEKILIPDFHVKGYGDDPVRNENLITGFVIDFDDLCIMYLEGLASGIMKSIWMQIKFTHKYAAKIFYNSDHIYLERLYGELIHYGGLYTVTLQFGVSLARDHKNLFLSGTHSMECRRAIQKLLVIKKLHLFSQVIPEILPTFEELKKLNKECGVPLINQKICNCVDCPMFYHKETV